jgi:glycosyltransferase involved in cell wall biosynthesis
MSAPISVVIPAYNAGAFIEATIRSIRAQTVAVAEIIVVNDGSIDDTSAVARAAGATVLDQQNLGLPASRNRGISAAKEPWIALADADDLWERNKIELQWRSLERAPTAAFSFCDFSQFNEKGVINTSVMYEVHRHFRHVLRTSLDEHSSLCDAVSLGAALLVQNVFCHSSILVRKEAVNALGGYDTTLLAAEDYEFVMRLTRDHVGTYVDLPLVHYRRHATAMTSNIPKCREALVDVALRTLKTPSNYSPQTSEHFRRELKSYLVKCAFAHIRYGEQVRAREWLRRSFRERMTFRGMLLYPLTFVVEHRVGRNLRNRLLALQRLAFESSASPKKAASGVSGDA